MTGKSTKIDDAILAICAGQPLVIDWESMLRSNAFVIVDRLVAQRTSAGDSVEAALIGVLSSLESFEEIERYPATALMLVLWERASGIVGMHEVCDHIDLAFADQKVPDASLLLNAAWSCQLDSDTRNHFAGIFEAVKNRGVKSATELLDGFGQRSARASAHSQVGCFKGTRFGEQALERRRNRHRRGRSICANAYL